MVSILHHCLIFGVHYNSYGQRPWQKGYADKDVQRNEQQTFRAFKGEYARKFGPKRRGITIQKLSIDGYDKAYVDDEKIHQYHITIPPFKKYK